MRKDIPEYKVEQLAVAVVPSEEDGMVNQEMWNVWVINMRESPIENVLVNSRGYGEVEGEQMRTTVLRHFFNEIGPRQACLIEPIQPSLFDLANEYWVSFTYAGYMYDKRYIFVRGSIQEENFTTIPLLEKKGVMIR